MKQREKGRLENISEIMKNILSTIKKEECRILVVISFVLNSLGLCLLSIQFLLLNDYDRVCEYKYLISFVLIVGIVLSIKGEKTEILWFQASQYWAGMILLPHILPYLSMEDIALSIKEFVWYNNYLTYVVMPSGVLLIRTMF